MSLTSLYWNASLSDLSIPRASALDDRKALTFTSFFAIRPFCILGFFERETQAVRSFIEINRPFMMPKHPHILCVAARWRWRRNWGCVELRCHVSFTHGVEVCAGGRWRPAWVRWRRPGIIVVVAVAAACQRHIKDIAQCLILPASRAAFWSFCLLRAIFAVSAVIEASLCHRVEFRRRNMREAGG